MLRLNAFARVMFAGAVIAWSIPASAQYQQLEPVHPSKNNDPWISAPTTQPVEHPATTRPGELTPEKIAALHHEAIDLMRAGKWQEAVAPMARVFFAHPLTQQPRSVVLNQAILDVKLRVNAARAVKNLTQYLNQHEALDELATNVLGSALDAVADRPNMRKSLLFQRGVTAWERANDALEQSRPKGHRWGTEWLDDKRYAHLQRMQQEWKDQVAIAQQAVDRAQWSVNTQISTYKSLMNEANYDDPTSAYQPGTTTADPRYRNGRIPRQIITDSQGNRIEVPGALPGNYNQENQGIDVDSWAAEGQAQRMVPDIKAAENRLSSAKSDLSKVKGENPRPYWPREYPPVDPASDQPAATTAP